MALPIGIGALTAAIYLPSIGTAPIYLHHDEVFFALNAQSIATTARDVNGRLLPLYFQGVVERYWYHPVDIYAMAASVKVFGLSEASLRLPSVLVGVLDVVLMYFISRRIFACDALSITAAGLMALTPAHFIHSRLAMDYIYTVPFLLGWLLCLFAYRDTNRPVQLFLGTLCLGVGFYSYIASVVMMPLYLVMTLLVLIHDRRRIGAFGVAMGGFILPLLPLVGWLRLYPQTFADATSKYTPDLAGRGVLHAVRESLHFFNITDRVTLYWTFFNPAYLFITGGGNVTNSTRFIGVFALTTALLIAVGFLSLLRHPRPPVGLLILFGFLTAPIAALGMLEPYAIDRELGVIPFGVLLAAFGLVELWVTGHRSLRFVAVVALVCVPLHFTLFYRDYFTDYRVRSAEWFERNLRGAAEEAIAHAGRESAPAVYISRKPPRIDYYWKLYVQKHHREDLLTRTVYFDSASFDARQLPPRTIVISDSYFEAEDAQMHGFVAGGDLKSIVQIFEPNGKRSFQILER
jgi:4-amino-4-deoxy-L-arabinose transferase-like glycosyltransferase